MKEGCITLDRTRGEERRGRRPERDKAIHFSAESIKMEMSEIMRERERWRGRERNGEREIERERGRERERNGERERERER